MTLLQRRVLIGLIIADLVIFGGWIAKEGLARARGVTVQLPIEGYDPRDVLSGHYVRFRLIAEREGAEFKTDPTHLGYCLSSGNDGRHHVTAVGGYGEACELFLMPVRPVAQDDPTPRFGVERFYVDERVAADLGRITAGADTYLEARVGTDGKIHPVELVIGGHRVSGK